MKSGRQFSARSGSGIRTKRVAGPVRDQISACILPMVVAIAATWRAFASFGDLSLSLVLGGAAFVTVIPLTARVRGRDHARTRQGR